MKNEDFNEITKNKALISKMIIKRIEELCDLLTDAGESEIVGMINGWEFSLTKKTKNVRENN